MKIFIRGAAAALALSLVGVAPADGQLVPVDPSCTFSILNPAPNGTPSCTGSWAGNNVNQQADVLQNIWNTWGVTATYQGTTDAGMSGGYFQSVDGTPNGTVSFNTSLHGSFVLALKAANQFSLYYYDNVADIQSISYATNGVAVNKNGTPQGLSHASLYFTPGTSVPEPTVIFLLGSGLLAITGLAWRRRDEILA